MSAGEGNQKPQIFEYTDFRRYLRDLYAFLKSTQPHFSFRYFCRAAGFSSPSFLKLVMEGKRNLSTASIEKFARALKLNKKEGAFFRSLVQFNQADTAEERSLHATQLMRTQQYRKLRPLGQAAHEYFSSWHHIVIRELAGTRDFKDDPEWIAERLNPAISVPQARDALDTLLKLGLLQRSADGCITQSDGDLTSGDEFASSSLAQFHREMMRMASESIDRVPSAQRDISAVTVSLSAEGATRVKDLVQRFRKELLEVARGEQGADRVYQVNFQLFPVTALPVAETKPAAPMDADAPAVKDKKEKGE